MKKIVIVAFAASALLGSPALAKGGSQSPTIENAASCMAKARAPAVSTGGSPDRVKGGFGDAQSAFVQYLNSQSDPYALWGGYGAFVQWFFANCDD